MTDEKIIEIHDWMGIPNNYKKGVTNKQVKERFGSEYTLAWKRLKARTKILFHEEGRWHRWFN